MKVKSQRKRDALTETGTVPMSSYNLPPRNSSNSQNSQDTKELSANRTNRFPHLTHIHHAVSNDYTDTGFTNNFLNSVTPPPRPLQPKPAYSKYTLKKPIYSRPACPEPTYPNYTHSNPGISEPIAPTVTHSRQAYPEPTDPNYTHSSIPGISENIIPTITHSRPAYPKPTKTKSTYSRPSHPESIVPKLTLSRRAYPEPTYTVQVAHSNPTNPPDPRFQHPDITEPGLDQPKSIYRENNFQTIYNMNEPFPVPTQSKPGPQILKQSRCRNSKIYISDHVDLQSYNSHPAYSKLFELFYYDERTPEANYFSSPEFHNLQLPTQPISPIRNSVDEKTLPIIYGDYEKTGVSNCFPKLKQSKKFSRKIKSLGSQLEAIKEDLDILDNPSNEELSSLELSNDSIEKPDNLKALTENNCFQNTSYASNFMVPQLCEEDEDATSRTTKRPNKLPIFSV